MAITDKTRKILVSAPNRWDALLNKIDSWGYHDVLWDWYDELGASEKEE